MFPVSLKWIDDICDKIESVYTQVEDIVSKEHESSKYVESVKNVGNNVKQFCSNMDPLKYVEDQLTNVGTKIEQLCDSVVPSTMDTMRSAVNNMFPEKDPESAAGKKPELNDGKEEHKDSTAELVTSAEMNEVVSTGKFKNSKLDVQDNIAQTDQSFKGVLSTGKFKKSKVDLKESIGETDQHIEEVVFSGKFENSKIDLDEDTAQTDQHIEEVASSGKFEKTKVDLDEYMAQTVIQQIEEVLSGGKFEKAKVDVEDNITETYQYLDEDSLPIYDEFGTDEVPNVGFRFPGHTVEELKEETNANCTISQSPEKVHLDESCIVVDENDWFISQVLVADVKPPKIKRTSSSFLKFQRRPQMNKKSKSIVSREPSSIEKEPGVSLPTSSSNHDTWESDWEII